MKRTALTLTILFLASCTPAAAPDAAASGDVTEEDLGPLRQRAGCAAASDSLVCRALVAFAAGHRPSAPASPISMPGAVAVIPAPGSAEDGQPPIYGGAYLILAKGAARFQILLPSNAAEREASNALVAAITAGQPLPADNATVVYARARTGGTRSATDVGQSVTWSGESTGFLRETTMGLVVVERSPSVIMVAVFPR